VGSRVRAPDRRLRRGHPPLKVLDLTEFYSPRGGGVRSYLEAKARWLGDHTDIAHVILVPGPTALQTSLGKTTVRALPGPAVPGSPGYHFLTDRAGLQEAIAQESPDIIELGSPLLAARALRRATLPDRTRVVGYFHSDSRGYYVDHGLRWAPAFVRRAGGSVLAAYLRSVYGRLDLTICPSRYAESVLAWAGVENTVVVPHGVDVEVFEPVRGARDAGRGDVRVQSAKRRAHSIAGAQSAERRVQWNAGAWNGERGAGEGVVAVYAGRLSREKRLDTVLGALPRLHREFGLRLVVVGEGHLRPVIEAYATLHAARCTLHAFIEDRHDLANLYASADFVFAPCPYETFGLAAVEALACGTPIVGANRGAIGALLRDGAPGTAYDPDDVHDCVRAVREVMGKRDAARGAREGARGGTREAGSGSEEPRGPGHTDDSYSVQRAAYSKTARALVEERFTLDRSFGTLVEVYRELAK